MREKVIVRNSDLLNSEIVEAIVCKLTSKKYKIVEKN